MGAIAVILTKFKAFDGYSRVLRTMSVSVRRFTRKASDAFQQLRRNINKAAASMQRLSNKMKFGSGGSLLGGLALGAVVRQGAMAFLSLDKNISAAAAKFGIFNRESEDFIRLREKAIQTGATTEFTSGQSALALKNLATAGFTAATAIAGLNTVLDLATTTQSEIDVAADVSAKSLAAFGLKSKDPKVLSANLNMVADALNKIMITSGFGQLDEFKDVLAQSGSSARAAGVDIRLWGAIVAGSVSEAVPASTAGTRFANMLDFMTQKTKKFNKHGITLKDKDTGGFRNIVDIMADVDKNTKKMDSFDRAGLLLELFGKRGSKMAASLLLNGIPALRAYQKEIVASEGVTKTMAEFMRSGLTGGVAAMKSGFESIAIAIGDVFQPEINQAIKDLTEMARGAKDWIKDNKSLIKTIWKVTKLVLKFIIAVKLLTGAITFLATAVELTSMAIVSITWIVKMATTSFVLMGVAMNAIPIVALITALVALGISFNNTVQDMGGWVNLWAAFGDLATSVLEGIKLKADLMLMPFQNMIANIKEIKSLLAGDIGFDEFNKRMELNNKMFSVKGALKLIQLQAQERKASAIVNRTNFSGYTDPARRINNQATGEQIRTERSENNNNATLTIKDPNNRTQLSDVPEGVKINIDNTSGAY